MPESLPQPTTTAFSGITYWVCACCADHADRPLERDTAECSTCGQPCNCYGCVAESA